MNAIGRGIAVETTRRGFWLRWLESMAILCVVAAWWIVPAVVAKEARAMAPGDGPLVALSAKEVAKELAGNQLR